MPVVVRVAVKPTSSIGKNQETVNLNAAASYMGKTTYAYALANFPGGAQTFNHGENLTVRFVFTYNAN